MPNKDIRKFLVTKELKKLVAILDKDKFRFIGGCVRDFILGIKINDYDLATSYTPDQVQKILDNHKIKYHLSGLKHGTVAAIINKKVFEITTLRKDIDCDGRHAEVEFTTSWEQDSNRRDFTINAISMDFDGNIYDFHNGIQDLQSGTLKFIGNPENRIIEDYLRILRLFRFWSYYGKQDIDYTTLNYCQKLANHVHLLSGTRVKAELEKIILSPKAISTLDLMTKYDILNNLGFACKKDFTSLKSINDIEVKYKIEKSAIRRLYHIIKPTTQNINQITIRLQLSNQERKFLSNILECNNMHLNAIIYYYGKELAIEKLICNFLVDQNEDNFNTKLQYVRSIENFYLPINGDDLIKFDIQPGKLMGTLLKQAEKLWIESEFTITKEQILQLILNKK